MTEREDDLRAMFRTVADRAHKPPEAEGKLLAASRQRRLMTAGAATLSLLLLVGGIAGASILWEPDGDPAPPAHSDCQDGSDNEGSECQADPTQHFARYFFEAAKEDMSVNGVVEVNSEEGTLCLEGTFSDNIVASHLLWTPEGPDDGPQMQEVIALTFFDPNDDEVRASLPVESPICLQEEQLDVLNGEFEGEDLQTLIDNPEDFRIDFHRGPNDDPGLVAELSESPPQEEDEAAGCQNAPRPKSDRRGSFVFYPQSARQEGSSEVLPVVFPDGSTAEVLYPTSLQLDELYAAPFLVGGSKKDGMMRPRISYGGVSFRVEGPIDCLPGPKGEQVAVWRAENQKVIVLRFSEWHVSVFGRNTDLALWAENLRGAVAARGWLTLVGENGLLLGPQFRPGDSELLFGDRRNILTVRPLNCSSRRYRDEGSETSVSFCADNVQVNAQGNRDFVEQIGEALSVRNLETAHPLKDYVVLP